MLTKLQDYKQARKITNYQSVSYIKLTDYQSVSITRKKSNQEFTSIINGQTNHHHNHHLPMNHQKQCISTKEDTRMNGKLSWNTSHENEGEGKKTRSREET